jgi:hypothetical protein
LCIFQIVVNISNYLDYSVVTTTQIVDDPNPPFPAIRICSLNSEPVNIIECNYQNVGCRIDDEFEFNDELGCVTFNNNVSNIRTYTRSTVTSRNGLYIEMFIGEESSSEEAFSGAEVYIFLPNKNLRTINDFQAIALSAGQYTFVQVSRTKIKRLSWPYSNCVESISRYTINNDIKNELRKVSAGEDNYIQQECLSACFSIFVLKDCANDVTNDDSNCNNTVVAKCYSLCPPQCESTVYSASNSMLQFPTRKYAERIKQIEADLSDFSYEQLKESVLAVEIYYESLSYVSVSENAKITIADLIVNIGSNLGLFLGFSVLTFAEAFEVIFRIGYALFLRFTGS